MTTGPQGDPKGVYPKGVYTVGYGKPPLHSRFKPGNRANPAGRPRGAKGLKTILARMLDRRVVVTEDGKRRRLTKRELGFARLVDKFAEGDMSAAKLLVEFELALERLAPDAPAERPALEQDDKEVIRNWAEMIRS
jgi:Family of unknown function (DUF5681)